MIYLRVLFLTMMFAANAYSFSPIVRDNNSAILAEQCRLLSLELYKISSHQSRPGCQANLDGLNVYYASTYITHNWIYKAQEVLFSAIIQVKYALDIGCDDPTEISAVIKGLQSVSNNLNEF